MAGLRRHPDSEFQRSKGMGGEGRRGAEGEANEWDVEMEGSYAVMEK